MDEVIGNVRIWGLTLVGAYGASGLAVVAAVMVVVCGRQQSVAPAFDPFIAWALAGVLLSTVVLGTAQAAALSLIRHRPWLVGTVGMVSFWSVAAASVVWLMAVVSETDARAFGSVLLPSQGIGGLAFWAFAGWLEHRERAGWPALFVASAVSGLVALGLVAGLVLS